MIIIMCVSNTFWNFVDKTNEKQDRRTKNQTQPSKAALVFSSGGAVDYIHLFTTITIDQKIWPVTRRNENQTP
jgi:hypothetical protein